MSWLLIGMGGVIIAALIIYFLAPKSRDRRGSFPQRDETPLAATRVAEETYHGARIGAVQGRGFVDSVGPLTGTLPRNKSKDD
ncbi:MAG: hypothetical protein JW779_05200 [Candidatus Thorarchaeota archaeon]|nr:hypothetical protein [Candidatus Thorarchaeota archaeon]